MLPGAPSGSEVDQLIAKVRRAAANLTRRTDLLVEGTIVATRRLAEKSILEHEATRQNTMSTLIEARGISQQVLEMSEAVKPLPGQIKELQHTVEELKDEMSHLEREAVNALTSMANHAGVDAQNWTKRLLDEIWQGVEARMRIMANEAQKREQRLLMVMQDLETEIERARTPQLPSNATLSTSEILGILAVSPERITADLKLIIQGSALLDPASQLEAQSLLNIDRFWQWFSSASSDLLFVHGSLVDDPTEARISPISPVCATMVAAIIKTHPSAVSLYFFCGFHMDFGDNLKGPQGLMRCLISKLLVEASTRHPMGLTYGFADLSSTDGLRHHDMSELCSLFRRIIMQLPRDAVVYCIIDGVSWYERLEMLEDIFLVMQTLSGLVDDPYLRPALKVLLTSPFPSKRIAPGIPTQRRVFLRPMAIANEVVSERMIFANLTSRARQVPAYATANSTAPGTTAVALEEERTAEDYL